MRVLLNLRKRQRDEQGAVAIMVAVLAVVLFAGAAFVVDVGQAYASKRELQTSSDSAALAAAAVYADYTGTCGELAANGEARTAAQQAADDYREANRPEAVGDPITVECAPSGNGTLWVTVDSEGDTGTVFAPVIGGPDEITTSRTATAVVEVSPDGGPGFRPLAMCTGDLPNGGVIDGSVVKIYSPGSGHIPPNTCPAPSTAGNWWTIDCPEERTGSTPVMADQVLNGCTEPVSIVPGQDTATDLAQYLRDACPSAPTHSETCLSGDSGRFDNPQIMGSWKTLIDNHEEIMMPVFLPQTITGTGTNSVYPVHKMAGMFICGYHFDKQNNTKYQQSAMDRSPACAAAPDVYSDNTRDAYLVVVYTEILTSSENEDNECALGNTLCDGGARRVRLVQ